MSSAAKAELASAQEANKAMRLIFIDCSGLCVEKRDAQEPRDRLLETRKMRLLG